MRSVAGAEMDRSALGLGEGVDVKAADGLFVPSRSTAEPSPLWARKLFTVIRYASPASTVPR